MPVHNFAISVAGNPQTAPDALASTGFVIPIEIHVPKQIADALTKEGKPLPPPVVGLALIDTGATLTAIHDPLLQTLGLNPISTVKCGTANGQVDRFQYPAFIRFPTIAGVEFHLSAVTGVDLTGHSIPTQPPQPMIGLIGRDLLRSMLLVWNGTNGTCTLGT